MPRFPRAAGPAATLVTLVLTLAHPSPARAMPQTTAANPAASLPPAPTPVEALAIVNARVWTGDPRRPWADAVLVRGARIEAVGSSAEVKKRAAGARVVDAKGMMVAPGFVDAHVHFLDGGFALSSVQLRDARTKEEFIARIRDFARTVPAGTWILNGDWDHTNWAASCPSVPGSTR